MRACPVEHGPATSAALCLLNIAAEPGSELCTEFNHFCVFASPFLMAQQATGLTQLPPNFQSQLGQLGLAAQGQPGLASIGGIGGLGGLGIGGLNGLLGGGGNQQFQALQQLQALGNLGIGLNGVGIPTNGGN